MVVIQGLYGSFKPAVPVTGITLDKTTATLKTGESLDLTVTVQPDTASNKRFTVAADNNDLVTIAKGTGNTYTITAKADTDGGTATITVASRSNPAITATLTITVRVPVTAITVDKPTVSGDTKTSVDVTFTIAPENATDKGLEVASSDAKTASVALKSGTAYTISYLKGGTATITAKSKSDPTVTATVNVTAIQTGPSDEEKDAWRAARIKEAKTGTYKARQISADYEPLEGWTPFADYGTDPAEIIAGAMKDYDSGNWKALIPGDWYDVTVQGNKLRYEVSAIDQYLTNSSGPNTKHHCLMVPQTCWPTTMVFDSGGDNTYLTSGLHKWEENTFYSNLPAKTKANVLQVNIPWWTTSGQAAQALAAMMEEAGIVETVSDNGDRSLSYTAEAAEKADVTPEEKYAALVREAAGYSVNDTRAAGLACHVFSLSEIEVQGAKIYSSDSIVNPGTANPPNHHLDVTFATQANRARTIYNNAQSWWLRSAYASSGTNFACCVYTDGSATRDGAYLYRAAVPCFCLG